MMRTSKVYMKDGRVEHGDWEVIVDVMGKPVYLRGKGSPVSVYDLYDKPLGYTHQIIPIDAVWGWEVYEPIKTPDDELATRCRCEVQATTKHTSYGGDEVLRYRDVLRQIQQQIAEALR